jgi:hypothetical protein
MVWPVKMEVWKTSTGQIYSEEENAIRAQNQINFVREVEDLFERADFSGEHVYEKRQDLADLLQKYGVRPSLPF